MEKTRPKDTEVLQIVLKCSSVGSLEALMPLIVDKATPEMKIEIIHSDVGSVSKSDIQMAVTGNKLIFGFEVDVLTNVEPLCRQYGVEVRLHNVIYQLVDDISNIVSNLIHRNDEEEVSLGEAKIIALFKSSKKGIILGCEVIKGTFTLGSRFRIISAMGPKYTGRIRSLQVDRQPIKSAGIGKQVGLKIEDFKDAKVGEIVECFETKKQTADGVWHPTGGVFRKGI